MRKDVVGGGLDTRAFTPETLTAYLHDHIPLTAAMELSAETVTWDHVRLYVPIRPNLNHNRTAFGGSLSSALVMAGWSLIHNRLRACGYYTDHPQTQLVVSRSETRYHQPVAKDFAVDCVHENDGAWSHFLECLRRKSRAKLRVEAAIQSDDGVAAAMKGAFVAVSDV